MPPCAHQRCRWDGRVLAAAMGLLIHLGKAAAGRRQIVEVIHPSACCVTDPHAVSSQHLAWLDLPPAEPARGSTAGGFSPS